MFGVTSGKIAIRESYIDYCSFGKGTRNLVILPGLSTRGIKGSEMMLAYMYRMFGGEFRVFFLDRIQDVPEDYTIEDMAEDTVTAMKELKINKISLFGVSQGGMISQVIAERYPDFVEKVVLGVTSSKSNEMIETCVARWIEYAKAGDYISLNIDTFYGMYSEEYLKKYRIMIPIAAKMIKPQNLNKFIILAEACVKFNGYESLDLIKCSVLVLGGRKDKVVSGKASEEIAEKLGCDIYMYDELGHAAYDEAKDFNDRVYAFLLGGKQIK
ncbi:MAG: alpha/beta hydrolase [Pseudobutyrivibrio sp.]|nr:alpha/beta hydrolase [Pseudobutyrivibrio sp.]